MQLLYHTLLLNTGMISVVAEIRQTTESDASANSG